MTSLESVKTAYIERLRNSVEAIDNILTQRQLGPLSKDDLLRAQYLTHGLSGSAGMFGFMDISNAAGKADQFLGKVIKNPSLENYMGDKFFEVLEGLLLALRALCLEVGNDNLARHQSGLDRDSGREEFHALIIDDDKHIAHVLSLSLEQKGIHVTTAPTGEAALQAIARQRPDLIILDIALPGISGHEVLRRLKQDPVFVNIPVLMLTGNPDRGNVIAALSSGAIDYIVKPFNPEQLAVKVAKILNAARHLVKTSLPTTRRNLTLLPSGGVLAQ